MSKILLAEGQDDLAFAMRDWFHRLNFTIEVVKDGMQALECLRQNQYDVIILEIALSRLSGIEVVRSYREGGGSAPVVMIAAKHSSDELEYGLDAGADIFVVKPFELRDLAVQVKALLRRPSLRSGIVLASGGIALDTGSMNVTKDGKIVHLPPMELRLLEFLLKHPNEVFSTEALLSRVWTDNSRLSLDTVRTHIKTLRHKIDAIDGTSIITTVRGGGYKIDAR